MFYNIINIFENLNLVCLFLVIERIISKKMHNFDKILWQFNSSLIKEMFYTF